MRKMNASARSRRLVVCLAWPALLTLLLSLLGPAPALTAMRPGSVLQPIDTSSPRATFQEFRDNLENAYRQWRLRQGSMAPLQAARRALRTLDLGHVGDALADEIGLEAALYLYETTSRIDLPPPAGIPDAAMVEAEGLTRWTIPGTEITIARVADGERAGEFLFTRDTVARARQFYELVEHLPVLQGVPDVVETWRAAPGLAMPNALAARIWGLPGWAFYTTGGQPIWKWASALLAVALTIGLVWLAWRAGSAWDRRASENDSGWLVGQPLAALAAIVALAGLEVVLQSVVVFREAPGRAVAAVVIAARYAVLAWLVAALIAAVGRAVVQVSTSSAASLDAALIRLCFRVLSIVGALLVLLHAASEFGLSVTPIIAGLGVGGLAVALAVRPTLENIVGGFVLFADKPVRVGEFCSFGDKLGTVEEIGLRSTRIRGLDRTVITVPNADFAQMQIVNFTRRDMNLYQCSLGLRYETAPGQLRYVAAKIRKLLIRHSKVLPDPARVRFSEFGASALVLEVFAFVRCADWNEFLAVKEDLNLRIAEIVRDSGTAFAFPSRTVYFGRDPGVDVARGEQNEAEVRRWRAENRLPFPDFEFAERAEMADTLAFPPEGSPDYRPTAPADADGQARDERGERKQGWPALLRRRKD
jgi:MscS family membrane protein